MPEFTFVKRMVSSPTWHFQADTLQQACEMFKNQIASGFYDPDSDEVMSNTLEVVYQDEKVVTDDADAILDKLDDPFIDVKERFVCVSTGHITADDDAKFRSEATISPNGITGSAEDPLIWDAFVYGWWVHVPTGEKLNWKQALRDYGWSKYLVDLLAAAKDSGAQFLKLDRDGETYSAFPQFEW